MRPRLQKRGLVRESGWLWGAGGYGAGSPVPPGERPSVVAHCPRGGWSRPRLRPVCGGGVLATRTDVAILGAGLAAGQLSVGAPVCVMTFRLHETSWEALLGPGVVLGLMPENELLGKRQSFRSQLRARKAKEAPLFGPLLTCRDTGSCSCSVFSFEPAAGLNEAKFKT